MRDSIASVRVETAPRSASSASEGRLMRTFSCAARAPTAARSIAMRRSLARLALVVPTSASSDASVRSASATVASGAAMAARTASMKPARAGSSFGSLHSALRTAYAAASCAARSSACARPSSKAASAARCAASWPANFGLPIA